MEFRILGPLEALDGGRRIALAGDKQQALLALLAIHANQTLSRERLIDELWGEEPPTSAAKAVQVLVSRLRSALEAGGGAAASALLVTRDRGYELRVDPEHVDLLRFERLVADGRRRLTAGRPAQAVQPLEAALALWHGSPLGDLRSEAFVQREVGRLEELRVDAYEQLIEAKLALGDHAVVVGELERLIAEHPYRERLWAQLMLALYRCDRQADALQAYQDARRRLAEELGIEPGVRLRELERAILAQDPALAIPDRASLESRPEPTQPSRSVFVGRGPEMAELVSGLDDAFSGRGRLFLLVGEPGIGKTRLAMELVAHARDRAARVLMGRCWEAGGAPAYWPWVQSLREYVRERDMGSLGAELGSGAADVAQLLPELWELLPGLRPPASGDPGGARFRLFEAVSSFLRSASLSCPIVLVLDDLHAADEPSLLLLRFLAQELSDSRLLVIGALRDVDPSLREPLSSAIADLSREPVVRRIVVDGLDHREVARFVELTASRRASDALIGTIQSETGGNPLFVGEVVRLLVSEGRLENEGGQRLGVPQGVRDAIARRVGRLSGTCGLVLTLASVFGREFRIDALERLAGLPGPELIGALDEAMAERIVVDVPGARGWLRFAHAIIRDTVYERLTAARRMSLHAQTGDALERLYGENAEPHFSELAHHYAEAGAAGGDGKAVCYARLAAERAARLLAFEEAARLYRLALEMVGGERATGERCELLLALGDVQARAGAMDAAKQTFVQAAQVAREHGSRHQLARAALGYGGRFSFARAGVDERLMPLLEEALATLDIADSPLRARLLARLAGAHRGEASREPRVSLARQAIEVARRAGDTSTLGYVLEGAQLALWDSTDPGQRTAVGNELLAISEQEGDLERAVLGRLYRFVSDTELGDLPAADLELAQMSSAATKLGQPAQLSIVLVCRAMRALLTGALTEAETLIHEVLRLGERADTWIAGAYHQLCALRREQGRLAELEHTVQRSITEHPNYSTWHCALIHLHAATGKLDQARREFQALAADKFTSLPIDEEWTFEVSLLAEVCTALGDVEQARTLYELLLPYSRLVAYGAPEVSTGAVSRYLGILASSMACWNDADQHFRHALELNAKMQARPWLARTQVDYARTLRARGRPDDRARADELLIRGAATFRSLGMNTHAAKASNLEYPPRYPIW